MDINPTTGDALDSIYPPPITGGIRTGETN